MNALLREYLAERDYGAVARSCIDWIRSWFDENGSVSPAVIGSAVQPRKVHPPSARRHSEQNVFSAY